MVEIFKEKISQRKRNMYM